MTIADWLSGTTTFTTTEKKIKWKTDTETIQITGPTETLTEKYYKTDTETETVVGKPWNRPS